jgi:hemoglobin/transferrin/lactoferrin receptor protein
MYKVLIFLFLAIMPFLALSQILTIKDSQSRKAIEMVTIYSDQPNASALTNHYGQADISEFQGSSRIEFRMIGYQNKTRSFSDLQEVNFIIFLQPTNITLDQFVVVASRWNQSRRDVPSKISTLTPQSATLHNPQTTADLLAISGEVFIQKSQLGGGSPMIRGFSSNRLLMVVDGVRMNTAIFRSGNLQNVISLDPFATERVEILFGPGSVTYGSDAIGGVMSFSTLTPKLAIDQRTDVSGNAVTRYSSANRETTGHFDVNVGWNKWAVVTSFSHFNFGDLRMGSHGPDEYLRPFYTLRIDSVDRVITNPDQLVQNPTGYSQTSMMQKVRFMPGENWDFVYGLHYSVTSDYSRYDRLLRTRNGLPRSAEWYYGPQEWMMNNLTATHSTNNSLFNQMSLRLAGQNFRESRHDRNFNSDILRNRIEKVNAFSANVDFVKETGEAGQLFYGLEGVYNDVNSMGTDENVMTGLEIPGPSRYPESTWESYAGYITYVHKLSERAILQAGGRYNYFIMKAEFDTAFYPFPFTQADISQGALTGSLGMVFKPTQNWTWSTNLSTGFRSPNVDDMGKVFDSEPGFVVIPNPGLSPEYAYNAEIATARTIGERVKVDVTAFYTYLDDALVRRNFRLNGMDSMLYDGEMSRVQAILNAASAKVWGVQAGLEVKLPAGFGFISNFNYQKGEEELDDGSFSRLRHAAPWFGVSRLTFSTLKLRFELFAQYNGAVNFEDLPVEEREKTYMYASDEHGNPYSPAWYTLNFKTHYQLTECLSVSGGIENLTDRRYRPYSSGIVAPGRNFILSLQAGF